MEKQEPEKEPKLEVEAQFGVRATWMLSLETIQESLSVETDDARETMIAAYRWCIDPRHPMTRDEFARRVGYSQNTVYRVFTGRYMDPEAKTKLPVPVELLRNIKEFLKIEQERFAAGKTEFVITPTARRFWTGCELARESQSIVIIYGPSHIGKTWAAREFTQRNNHGRTFFVELDAASGLGGMVRRVADGCGISARSNTHDLVARIKRALTPNTLLIIDEVHLLHHTYRKSSFFGCIEVLRRIHDFTQCGMVLSWTLLDNLRAASQGELQQVWRRGVHKFALPLLPTKGDLTAILKASGLDFPEKALEVTVGRITEKPYDVLHQIAKRDGLKAITERIRYGRKLAAKLGQGVTWHNVIDAHLRISREAVQQVEWE